MQRLGNPNFLNSQRLLLRGRVPRFRAFYTPKPAITSARMGIKTDIVLYTASTPNGVKVPILLEELGLEYKVRPSCLRWGNQCAVECKEANAIPAVNSFTLLS